jgi:hypothetical protein
MDEKKKIAIFLFFRETHKKAIAPCLGQKAGLRPTRITYCSTTEQNKKATWFNSTPKNKQYFTPFTSPP